MQRWVGPFLLAILGGCSVRGLSVEGRPCSTAEPCGPGTICNPVKKVCVLPRPMTPDTGALEAGTTDRPTMEGGQLDARSDGPRVDHRKTDLPKVDLAKIDLPRIDGPRVDLPKPDAIKPLDLGCPSGAKLCDGGCVSVNDPAYGCASTACTACPTGPNQSASCSYGGCKATCNSGFDDCTSALGCETAVLNDPAHCGRCNHSCLGGGCISGACQPLALVSGTPYPVSIALDSTSLFWANSDYIGSPPANGNISSIAKDGKGAVLVLAQHQANVNYLTIDATRVYWTEAVATGDVISNLKDGTTPIVYSNSQYYPAGVTVDATYVYWTVPQTISGAGAVRKALKTGSGNVIDIVTDRTDARSITTDGVYLFWAIDVTSAGKIERWQLPGGPAVTLASNQSRPTALTLDGNTLYWANRAGGTIMSTPKTGTTIPSPLVTGQTEPTGLAVDPSHVYWTDRGVGKVLRVTKGGGSVETLASGQSQPRGIAVDNEAVYWVNFDSGGSVMKLAKP